MIRISWAVRAACTVDGLLGEVPMRPVGAPEKIELLNKPVKDVREQVVIVSLISDYCTPLRRRLLISLSSRRFLTNHLA
jgi:hypothetical protein